MNRILIDCSVHQIDIALVENGNLTEYFIENKQNESIVGNIYAGRVEAVLPGMQSAFVNIGQNKNAYYYYGKDRAKTDTAEQKDKKIKVGDTVMVQVEKDAVGEKGAVVTDKLSFAGKFIVLLPDGMGEIGISKKIAPNQKNDIEKRVKNLLPEGFSMIVRTNGAEKTALEFETEIKALYQKAQNTIQQGQYFKPPALLYQYGNAVLNLLKDICSDDIDEIVVNEQNMYHKICKEYQNVVLSEKKYHLFGEYFIEKQAQKAFDKKVWLKSGGFLLIEQTEACVVIDVNTGKYTGKKNFEKTILKTNLEAAEEIAKQIRLRNLSGIIIIDFIDMATEEYKETLTKALKQFVKKDRVKTSVIGMTELGLMQMTRKKTRPSLQNSITTKCKCCNATGRVPTLHYIASQITKQVTSIFENTIYQNVIVEAPILLLNAFCGENEVLKKELENQFQKKITCIPNQNMSYNSFHIIGEVKE